MQDQKPVTIQWPGIPTTIDQWELTLVRHFLSVGPDGDASDIGAFEVSGRTLCDACGVSSDAEEQVIASFKQAITGDRALPTILRDGSVREPTREAPNFFTHLALTLFIDILLDTSGEASNAFRHKLRDWCGTAHTFTVLRGVELMWKELVIWLEQRVAEGLPFRRLVLPARPETWTHIGYTRRLSFPNRSDMRQVEHVLESCASSADLTPRVILYAFAPLLETGKLSEGLREAVEDFHRAYLENGRRALGEHRFWRLISRVLSGMTTGSDNTVTMEMSFTENGEREYRLLVLNEEQPSWYERFSAAARQSQAIKSVNVGPALRRGVVVFRPVGMGRWQAERDLTRCRTQVHVAVNERHVRLIGNQLGRVDQDGFWYITRDPVPVAVAEDALKSAGIGASARDDLFSPIVLDGVRLKEGWLGLPRFLPAIECDNAQVKVRCGDTSAVPITIHSKDGAFFLYAERPLSGVYNVEPELLPGEVTPPWRRRLQFVKRASPHLNLDGALRRLPKLEEWARGNWEPVICGLPESPQWETANEAIENLLEAVYAAGRGGWAEQDLVSLVRRAGDEAHFSPWRTIRMLQDGSVLEPRLRQGWKGRSWVLQAPRIVAATHEGTSVTLLEGACCEQMLEDFRHMVEGIGGRPFRVSREGTWSVPVIGALEVSAKEIAERFGWELFERDQVALRASLALVGTTRQAENYSDGSTWCWNRRHFVRSGAVQYEVKLTRRCHLGGTDHDVYRVEHRGRVFHYLSRHAAIIAAHAAAGVPIFHFDGERITVTAAEGALPDLIAEALRRRTLQAARIADECYSYRASFEDARWLLSFLPGCIGGISLARAEEPGEIISAVRRSGGALRLLWRDGQLTR